jgi:hypothetical protein
LWRASSALGRRRPRRRGSIAPTRRPRRRHAPRGSARRRWRRRSGRWGKRATRRRHAHAQPPTPPESGRVAPEPRRAHSALPPPTRPPTDPISADSTAPYWQARGRMLIKLETEFRGKSQVSVLLPSRSPSRSRCAEPRRMLFDRCCWRRRPTRASPPRCFGRRSAPPPALSKRWLVASPSPSSLSDWLISPPLGGPIQPAASALPRRGPAPAPRRTGGGGRLS